MIRQLVTIISDLEQDISNIVSLLQVMKINLDTINEKLGQPATRFAITTPVKIDKDKLESINEPVINFTYSNLLFASLNESTKDKIEKILDEQVLLDIEKTLQTLYMIEDKTEKVKRKVDKDYEDHNMRIQESLNGHIRERQKQYDASIAHIVDAGNSLLAQLAKGLYNVNEQLKEVRSIKDELKVKQISKEIADQWA